MTLYLHHPIPLTLYHSTSLSLDKSVSLSIHIFLSISLSISIPLSLCNSGGVRPPPLPVLQIGHVQVPELQGHVAVRGVRVHQPRASILPARHGLQGRPHGDQAVGVQRGHVQVRVPAGGGVARALAEGGVLVQTHALRRAPAAAETNQQVVYAAPSVSGGGLVGRETGRLLPRREFESQRGTFPLGAIKYDKSSTTIHHVDCLGISYGRSLIKDDSPARYCGL